MKPPRRGHVVQLDTDTHQAVQQMLPWYVTGRLDDSERGRIEAHLAACPHCQAELDWERRLQALHASSASDDPDTDTDGGASARWDALRLRAQTRWGRMWQGMWPAMWQRLRHRLRRSTTEGPPASPRWLTPLSLTAVGALSVVSVGLWMHSGGEPTYRTLSAPGEIPAADAIVMFDPAISEQAMRAALAIAGARVVGGPTAAGAWLLQLPEGDQAAALQRLKGQPAVRLAEPLAHDGATR